MPGYSLTNDDPDEARLTAIQTLIQSRIGDLDTNLQRAPLSMPAGTAASALVIIGDPDTLDSSTPFVVCISGGGKADGADWESDFRYTGMGTSITPGSLKNTVHTQVRVYIHPDTFPAADATWSSVKTQTEKRERLLSRVVAFLRGDVFQTLAGVDMTLTSTEYRDAGDNLTMGVVRRVEKGRYEKSFAGTALVYGASLHIEHTFN